jgi:hypothetical protein
MEEETPEKMFVIARNQQHQQPRQYNNNNNPRVEGLMSRPTSLLFRPRIQGIEEEWKLGEVQHDVVHQPKPPQNQARPTGSWEVR